MSNHPTQLRSEYGTNNKIIDPVTTRLVKLFPRSKDEKEVEGTR
jgi:hypothetical protein